MATGIEIAAVAGIGWVASKMNAKEEQRIQEQVRVASDLYKRFFNADLLECSSDTGTTIVDSLPSNIDPHAVAAIREIENYQEARRNWFAGGMFRGEERIGDAKTRVVEEMKQWLARATDKMASSEIEIRLEYCRQLVLRQAAFKSKSGFSPSFLQTMAAVCQYLEALSIHATEAEWNGAAKLERILTMGKALADGVLPVILFSLTDETAVPSRSRSGTRPPDPINALDLLQAFRQAVGHANNESNETNEHEDTNAPDKQRSSPVNWSTSVGHLIKTLLCHKHFQRLYVTDSEVVNLEAPAFSQDAVSWWTVGQSIGFMDCFVDDEVRTAYLNVCENLDRVVYFLSVLEPLHKITAIAGESAMHALSEKLTKIGRTLEELIRALASLRQARLVVMDAAKRQLQDLARRGPQQISCVERRWMQGLRHINEMSLDEIHRNLIAECTEVRSSVSQARMSDLRTSVQRNLGKLAARLEAAGLESGDVRARLAIRGPGDTTALTL